MKTILTIIAAVIISCNATKTASVSSPPVHENITIKVTYIHKAKSKKRLPNTWVIVGRTGGGYGVQFWRAYAPYVPPTLKLGDYITLTTDTTLCGNSGVKFRRIR